MTLRIKHLVGIQLYKWTNKITLYVGTLKIKTIFLEIITKINLKIKRIITIKKCTQWQYNNSIGI